MVVEKAGRKARPQRKKTPADAVVAAGASLNVDDYFRQKQEERGRKTAVVGLPRITAVSLFDTIPSYDYFTFAGGFARGQQHVGYGLSRGGKTTLQMLIYRAWLDAGGTVFHLPLERGDDIDYVEAFLGPYIESPRFQLPAADDVLDWKRVRELAGEFAGQCRADTQEMHAAGIDWVGGLFGVDSLTALQPDGELGDVARDNRIGDGVYQGRQGLGTVSEGVGVERIGQNNHWMRLAQQVGTWMWHLQALFPASNVAAYHITQASKIGEKMVGGMRGNKIPLYGPKLGRGTYEAACTLNMVRAAEVDNDGDVPAQRHVIQLQKNKSGRIPDGQTVEISFFTRKDVVGLDDARNLVEGCLDAERFSGEPVVSLSGSWFKFRGKSIAQGRPKLLTILRSDPVLFAEIKADLRAHELRTRDARRASGRGAS